MSTQTRFDTPDPLTGIEYTTCLFWLVDREPRTCPPSEREFEDSMHADSVARLAQLGEDGYVPAGPLVPVAVPVTSRRTDVGTYRGLFYRRRHPATSESVS